MVYRLNASRSVSPMSLGVERLEPALKDPDGDPAGGGSVAVPAECAEVGDLSDDAPVNLIEVYPDGGRGWFVCLAVFLMNFAAWGSNLSLSIYINHYIVSTPEFQHLPKSLISLISASSLSVMLLVAPLSNYVENLVGVKKCVAIGAVINTIGMYLPSLTTNITYLVLTQAVLAGIGRGLMTTPCAYVLSQWFKKRCSLVTGIGHTGTGIGGMVFAYMTHYFLDNYGLNASYHANNILCAIVSIPCVLLVKSRCPVVNARTGEPAPVTKRTSILSPKAISSTITIIFIMRGFFSQWGYSFIRAIIPTYYSDALGKPKSEATNLQLIFSAGMAVGRPIMGLLSDYFGVTRSAILCESIALLSYYVLWLPNGPFPMIAVHSFIQGSLGGIYFLTVLPIAMLISNPRDLRSVVTSIWLVSSVSSMFSLYVSLLIVDLAESNGFYKEEAYRILIYFNSAFIFVAIMLSIVIHIKARRLKALKRSESSVCEIRSELETVSIRG